MSKVVKNFIAITILSSLVLSGALFWNGLGAEYGSTTTDTTSFNKTSEVNTLLTDFKTQSDAVVETDLQGVFKAVSNVVNTIKTLLASLNIFVAYVSQLSNVIKIPFYIITFVISIITIKTFVSYLNVVRGGKA